jgi:NIMA (never in mitosis gene a)-related kinase
MVTLRHAFDANSMKGLVLKILRGTYPAIPSNYSQDLKDLIADMLIKDPAKRPSMRKILEKEFLSRRISKLLTSTIAKSEFSATFLKKHITPYTKEDGSAAEESKGDSDNSASEDNMSVVSKQAVSVVSNSQQQIAGQGATSQQQ